MKKDSLAQDAFKLYVEKFMSLEDIAKQLHLNERTLRRWKKSDDWETKRTEYLRTKTTLHSDLYDFTRSLINSIEKDMENNGKVDNFKCFYCVHWMTTVKFINKNNYFLFNFFCIFCNLSLNVFISDFNCIYSESNILTFGSKLAEQFIAPIFIPA